MKLLLRLGSQVAALAAVIRGVRTARAEGDRLRASEALVHTVAVILTVAVTVREIRRARHSPEALGVDA
jgi:hypothetical protein